jgi:uncharacterized protein YciW
MRRCRSLVGAGGLEARLAIVIRFAVLVAQSPLGSHRSSLIQLHDVDG